MAKKRTRTAAPTKRRVSSVPTQKSRPTKAVRARSRAAKKGWETRRAKEKQRSDAARKGWKTRRANLAAAATRKRASGSPKRPGKRQPSIARAEFAVSADYRSRKRGSAIAIQIALRAPESASKADLEHAVAYAINHKGHAPPGYDIAIVDWKGADYAGGPFQNKIKDGFDPWLTLGSPLSLAELEISKVRKGEI